MAEAVAVDRGAFLSTLPAGPGERRFALRVVLVSVVFCLIAAPFAQTPLLRIDAFIPIYQSALLITDLITAVLLFGQYAILRSRAILVLASAYFFTALMVIPHTLTFPGLFASTGLLGATPQSTAWIYMFWHAGFPLLVAVYALLKGKDEGGAVFPGGARGPILVSLALAAVAAGGCALLATQGAFLLPAIMRGNAYTPAMIIVISTVWVLSALALVVLWTRKPHSVLDVWLMVVMCAWIFDVALACVFNAGRFDLGFYAGRVYGLMAASLVLMTLMLENSALYGRLAAAKAQIDDYARRLEVRVRSSEEKFRAIVEGVAEGIITADEAGVVSSINPAATAMFGYGEDQAIGMPLATLVPNPYSGPAAESRANHAAALAAISGKGTRELEGIRKGGATFPMLLGVSDVLVGDRRLYILVAQDLTTRKEAEMQLRQAQKMDAVGQLSGGIAHDFNNILTVIMGNLELLDRMTKMEGALQKRVETATRAARRGADLTHRLLAFSRKQRLDPKLVKVSDMVRGLEDMLRRTLGENIEIAIHTGSNIWPVRIDPSQLENAVLNLAVNARDAMPGGGKLTIETSNEILDASYAARYADVAAGEYAMVAVSDTGTGMPPEVVTRVFEPFFTTKEVGKGTGLGLAMVYGFIKQSEGHVNIYSEVGRGTTIKLYLPRAQADGAAAQATAASGTPMASGNETVLIVEDQEDVRDTVIQMFEGLGYKVLSASRAQAALDLLDRRSDVDLLFTDIVMPGGMDGAGLARAARRKRPDLKVLFTSGYTQSSAAGGGKLDPGAELLSKPYDIDTLAVRVRRVLEA